jgi:hypothetical protein
MEKTITYPEPGRQAVSLSQAARLRGVSRQRIWSMYRAGRFTQLRSPDGRPLVYADEAVSLPRLRGGRPAKQDE